MKKSKLAKLFDFLPKSKIKAGYGLKEGLYPFYTSSNTLSKYLNSYLYEPECLVFGTGGKASIHFTKEKFSTSTDCIVIRSKRSVDIDTNYVYQYLKANFQIVERGFKGAGLKHISKAYLADIQIYYPEKDGDQIRIATLLSRIEALIATRKENLLLLDDFLKSTFLEMFGDPVSNSMKWETYPLVKLARIERGRFSPRPRNDPKFFNGQYPYIQTGDINRSNGRLSTYTQTLNELGTNVSKEFKKGTVVIAIVGATIGETALLEIDVYAPDSVIGITPTSDKINSTFLEYLLRLWKPTIKSRAPEAARANINIKTLEPLKIIIPDRESLENFVKIDNKVNQLKNRYQHNLKDLENLYGAVSQKAFKGELDLSSIPIPDKDIQIKEISTDYKERIIRSDNEEHEMINSKIFSKEVLEKYLRDNKGKKLSSASIFKALKEEYSIPKVDDYFFYLTELLEKKSTGIEQIFSIMTKEEDEKNANKKIGIYIK